MRLKDFILELNRQRSDAFRAPEMQDWLHSYQVEHPTVILAFKCMDGRLNLPVMANMPTGIIQPFRNIGGIFDLGNPYLGRLVLDAKEQAIREGRKLLALCTYHFSKGDRARGCAGHNHDTQAAKASALRLKEMFERVFGKANPVVSAICVGVETDADSFIFHNGKEASYVISEHLQDADEMVRNGLTTLYPDMPDQVCQDLLPIAIGNRDHVKKIGSQNRPNTDLVHGENILCVGRGFSWLHLPNRALIIGPYNEDWGRSVEVAGRIISTNIEEGRVRSDDGVLLLALAPYEKFTEYRLAKEKARYLHGVAKKVLEESFPELPFDSLIGVTDMKTLLIEQTGA